MSSTRVLALTAAGLLAAGGVAAAPIASADASAQNRDQAKTVELAANLTELNGSGAAGTATATVRNQLIRQVDVEAHGLSPDAPHAIHIHYGDDARNECPTMKDATNERTDGTPRLSTVDGLPSYGPIVLSFTTTGDTSPASGLDLARMPISDGGELHYSRSNLAFTDVAGTGYTGGTGTAKQIADAIRDGEGVVVVHGVDYNGNGKYDFASAGASELNSAAPAEATDPAACGVLR